MTSEPVGDAVPDTPNGETPDGPPGMRDRITGVGEGAGRALLVPTLALLLALIVGALIIMVTDVDAWRRMGEDPGGALGDMVHQRPGVYLGGHGSRYGRCGARPYDLGEDALHSASICR